MGRIDVTELLEDPDFVEPMVLVTRLPYVNALGENRLKEISSNTFGSIQSPDGDVLSRLPEAFRTANVQSFWLKGKITASSQGQYPAILVFKSQRYQVQHVFDWTNWGAGWCEGTCVVEVPAP